jgi:hypothetical protein
MPGFWDRLLGRRREAAEQREAEEEQMSPEERRLADESFEDYQADEFIGEHFGSVDPYRPDPQDEPPRD